MNLKHRHLTDEVLLADTFQAAKKEQQMTLALLDYLLEVDRRKVYAIRAYSSLHQYVEKELGYSGGQASERVNAMRLMRDQPQARAQVESGNLTLTSAAQIQRFVQVEKKVGGKISHEKTAELIQECSGKPTREVERILLDEASVKAEAALKEQSRALPNNRTELNFSIGDKTEEKLQHVKNLLGNLPLEDLFDRALAALATQEEKNRGITRAPARRNESDKTQLTETATRTKKLEQEKRAEAYPQSSRSRFISINLKRAIFSRSGGQCEYADEKNGHRCNSRYRLQIDHRNPLALGGKTEFENLRHFCFQHNARAAFEAGLHKVKSHDTIKT